MTHDPRLPTLEAIMNGKSPFDIIDTTIGKMERWRAEALIVGTTSGVQSVYDAIRADAAVSQARADATEARNTLIQHVCDKIADFEKRFDALEARFTAAEDKRRADEAAQRKLDEEEIELPPDLDRPQDLPPSKIGDEAALPGGELHEIEAKEEPELEDPDFELEVEDADNIGDLPKELAPPPEPEPEPKGKYLPPPTALFGN
jgi:hypothetical protein